MIELTKNGIIYENGQINESPETLQPDQKSEFRQNTIAYQILNNHNTSKIPGKLKLKFDSLVSHDITYVGIIQSARESGMKNFPVPYTMTNCHNSLCAIGGTINEDDHVYGLSAAKKYGGIYVPANFAVMHQFEREMMAFGGGMILGSDSHTRYGALGTLAIGEGGPELVKQLLQNTYDIDAPKVILVYLENEPRPGVGPHDVAIALIKAVFSNEFAKNRILEFVGPGVKTLPIDFRNGIDVMTTETTCLSSIWETDEKVKEYYQLHHRPDAYRKLAPLNKAYYDGMVSIDLAKIEPMIALPFHPSNAYPIRELLENAEEILRSVEDDSEKLLGNSLRLSLLDKIHDGKVYADQGIIAGCAGGMFDNLCAAADILDQGTIGNDFFSMSVYPSSMPVNAALTENGIILQLQKAGVVNKPAFCGPCFGAGDIPSNNGLSILHTTRNFPNREGA
ncbi:MAG: hydratase, partial [Chloroflexi bacterium]|nr:hydratase [Chloroflexota bacterium]